MNYSVLVRRNSVISAILFLLMISVIAVDAWSADTDRLIIDLNSAQLSIGNWGRDMKSNTIMFGGMFISGNYPTNSWEVKQYTPTQYHIRHNSWGDFFWNIDCEQKKIWRMKGADLKAAGSDAKLLDDITVIVQKRTWPENALLHSEENYPKTLNSSSSKNVQKNEIEPHQVTTILNMTSPQLFLDMHAGAVRIVAGGRSPDADTWEVRRVSKDIYHLRFKYRQDYFYQINLTSMTVNQVMEGNFGFTGGHIFPLQEVVRVEDSNGSPSKSAIPVDLGMARYRGSRPKSAWQESEKALNEAVLTRGAYDVLVVPFQVGGYAIDRVDRSLMTRYLVQSLEQLTDLKLPSPTQVARALGEASRTFDDDVFQLANKLGVKQIIRGYVGHDLNERMSVTLVVQTRSEQEYFSPSTKIEKYTWNDIVISDERTPAEAFESILHDVSTRLQLPHVRRKSDQRTMNNGKLLLPANIRGIAIDSSSSLVERAYYLQFLGMLYPEQSVSKEQLFERSLVVLRELSPQSSAYKVLKARALFYLYRRPAAVVALGIPKGAEEKAVSAFINGDLQLLDKSIMDIKEPLPRLIAQIERLDLLWQYSPDQAGSESIGGILREYPGWEMILSRRLHHWDGWNVQSNLEVKRELDRLSPIDDFTAEDIVKSKMAIGEVPMDDDDIDFSVYNHYRRMMESQPAKLSVNESNGIVDRDVLDLMVSISESNLLKKIRLRKMQALYDEMLKLVDRYNSVYVGHPEMAYLKAFALYRIAALKQGQAQINLREEANQIQRNVCYWSQGQTEVSANRSCSGVNIYDADYPRRWYWKFSNDPKEISDRKYRGPQEMTQRGNLTITRFDRKGLLDYELSLLYTQTDFSILSDYYEKLHTLRMDDEAATLLEKNRNRFIGNSGRTSFFVQIAEREGNVKRARSIYKEAIALQANDWKAYAGLSSLLMMQGDYKAAAETALKYPLFSISKEEREKPSVDTVALSNHAFDIGQNLWWSGVADEAKPLFSLSAGYDTGSGAGIWSTIYLATLEHDFEKAAQASLENAKRYNLTDAFGNYMEFLHVMGYHDEAWSALKQTQGRSYGKMDWTPVLIGHRMEGKTKDEQIKWLQKLPLSELKSQNTPIFVFRVFVLDRETDFDLATQLRAVQEQIESLKNGSKIPSSQTPEKQSKPAKQKITPDYEALLEKRTGDPLPAFADGYMLLKRHLFTEAYEKLKVRFLGEWIYKEMFRFPVPYLSWSAAKSGGFSDIESYLSEYKKELGDDFDYYLSMAFLAGGKKDHREAIRNLNSARHHITTWRGMRYFPAFYQLTEACEWLYEDSKFEGYRELLLEFAKLRQTIRPMDSWAYAFEAKYTKSDADRIRALAITLYLDKRSERIAHFSEDQKSKALEWLKENNPFFVNQKRSQQKDI
jgi:hypothetical protein